MTFIQKYRTDIYRLLFIYSVFVLARALFITFMPHTYSRDLYSWLQVIDIFKNGGNPYTTTTVLNHPPFWLQTLYGVLIITRHTTISATFIIQLTLISGEAMIIFPLYFVLKRFSNVHNPSWLIIIGIALNPVCILLTCQHCNFDVFVGLWVLLFFVAMFLFYYSHLSEHWLMACFFLGIGILTKTVPLILCPLLLTGFKERKFTTSLFGLMLLCTPIALGMSIILALGQTGVINNVIAYRSMPGWYGITGILHLMDKWSLILAYARFSPVIIMCVMVLVAIFVYKANSISPTRMLLSMLLLLMALPTFGPGYSPSYIYWYLPLIIVAYCISSPLVKRFIIFFYIIVALTFIVEYACLDSHGAFLLHFSSSSKIKAVCDLVDSRSKQVILRLPMFITYITFFAILIRQLFPLQKDTIKLK